MSFPLDDEEFAEAKRQGVPPDTDLTAWSEGRADARPEPRANGRTMTARFKSRCRGCTGGITIGDTIVFRSGAGSFHPACATAAPAPAARSYGRSYAPKRGRCIDAPACGCCD